MVEEAQGTVLDILLMIFFSPLIVFYWRGTWNLLDLYWFPSNVVTSASVSVATSVTIMGAAFLIQDVLNKHIKHDKRVIFFVVNNVFTYIMAFAVVNNWRGLWYLVDTFDGVDIRSAAWNAGLGIPGLLVLRAYRNAIVAPGQWTLDVRQPDPFFMYTRFKVKKQRAMYALDVAFGILIISTFVFFVWRSKWTLVRLLVYPEDDFKRSIICIIVSHLLNLQLVCAQFRAMEFSNRLQQTLPRLHVAFEQSYLFVVCCTSVVYWCGLWDLVGFLLKGYDPYLTNWLLHVAGFGGLLIVRLSSSLSFRGYFRDGDLPEGLGVRLTPPYTRTFLKSSRCVFKTSKKSGQVETKMDIPIVGDIAAKKHENQEIYILSTHM